MNESLKRDHQRPEGLLIEDALKGPPKRSRRQLAEDVGLSEGRVRQIINGYRTEAGQTLAITAPADTLARMAIELGITANQMRAAGRDDVAEILVERPNVGVTEEGDLWLTSLDEERQLLADWIASDQSDPPPAEALALWTTEQLLEAGLRSHRDSMRLNGHIISVLNKRKREVDGPQATPQKNPLDMLFPTTTQVAEVPTPDENPPGADTKGTDRQDAAAGRRSGRKG